MQTLWNYHWLGVACLFPPGFGANNKAGYFSGALDVAETFMSNGKVRWQTGWYTSNGTLAHSLSPFTEWTSWRHGGWETIIDCDKKLYLTIPIPKISWRKRLLMLVESAVHYFFTPSWPDDRGDDPIENAQVQMRWIWFPMALAIIILAAMKRRFKNILVIITLGVAFITIFSEAVIIEGRYRKPWEGIAIATLLFLCTASKDLSLKPKK